MFIKPENLMQRVFIYFILFTGMLSVASANEFRLDTEINSGWLFKIGDSAGAEQTAFKEVEWEEVTLPHNWGVEEAQQGNKKYYRGPGWYRKELNIRPKDGKRYFIKFEAAGIVTDVYLNGVHLGQHRGAFGAFCYELTEHLSIDGVNVLAVRANNKKEHDIAPLGGDFNLYGGLYRSVHLIETPDVCFTLTDHASSGVAWLQTDVSEEKAILDVTAWIDNGTTNGLPFNHFPPELGEVIPFGRYRCVAKVLDDSGEIVSTEKYDFNITSHLTIPVRLRLEMNRPHLWNGLSDPYLYRAIVELQRDGIVVDSIEHSLGLRWFHVDPDTGFYLNGKSYRIRGVSKHQDRKDKGWAVSKADLDEDMALIQEIGANAIRCAHYQHSQYWMDLCDQSGILVWAELPQVGGMNNATSFADTSRNQMLDLIRQNVNHPSIFTWGMFNEIHVKHEDPHRQFTDLYNLVKSEDPTRFTVGATSHAHGPEMNKIPDLLGWNRYPGWYDPLSHLDDFDMWDKYKPTSRHGGFCFSEYGAGANIEHHEQNPEQPVPAGFWHPEEWQAIAHEAHWACFSRKPYIWGTFAWNMFDFCAVRRREGGKVAINDKGLVTFDRKVRKDAFFFYKANWSEVPVLHLTSKRHLIRNKVETPIKVYSNRGPVTLTVNGQVIGTVKPTNTMIAKWDRVLLKEGDNKIVVTAGDLIDEIVWTYDPNAVSRKVGPVDVKRIGGDGGFGQ
jgi:beta-galactosidase